MAENNGASSTLPFQAMPAEEVLEHFGTGPEGLSEAEAAARFTQYGPNELAAAKKISPLAIFFRQFASLLMIILLVASVISYLAGETLDAVVILVILLACAILGFVQEYRAEQAAAALAKMAAPTATVIREGLEDTLPSREVVPGDLLVLYTGDRVAADGRMLEAVNLKADEALLTGESIPVGKNPAEISSPDAPVGDQSGMVFGGTVITYGRGRAVVTATGMTTEFGTIARMLEEVDEGETPLEKRMTTIGRVLSVICLSVAVGAVLLGLHQGEDLWKMVIWGISLAVAAVPEALPAVVTGALAIGTTRMARRHAIIKRLPAVETMGSTTVICTDKTGTLTKNEMTVRRLYLDGKIVEVTGSGYEPKGEFRGGDHDTLTGSQPVLSLAGRLALLCNDAILREEEGTWEVQGDPTEGALLVMGRKAGLDRDLLLQEYPRVAEIPFDSDRKRMSTFHEAPEGFLMCTKGAPESLLPWCTRVAASQGEAPLTEEGRQEIMEEAEAMAAQALRVLGLAYRPLSAIPDLTPAAEEADLVWVGLVGMIDPPRPEAEEAVRRCHLAGIRVLMVTGDHPDTAQAVARELGLGAQGLDEPDVLTGQEVNALDDAELLAALQRVSVFARVSPEHKLRLVNVLKAQGQVVAMTGDGVNDAPALKRADIGVAMGLTGTEVTKETAAMILADDNFASLVAAVEEGRAIFDNIKKYLIFLLSCNFAEILTLTGAILVGLPLPLLALQILWVNLTTDGLPALALGVDPKAPDIMGRPPRPPGEGVFTRPVNVLLVVISAHLTLILLPLFAYYVLIDPHRLGDPAQVLIQAQTMVFVTLVLAELVNAFNCRSARHSLFRVGFFQNRFLTASVVLSLVMIVAVIQWQPLAHLFHTRPLGLGDWLIAAGLSLTLLPVVEVTKWVLRRQAGPA